MSEIRIKKKLISNLNEYFVCVNDLQVSDTDLEVIAATGRSPSEDSGVGMTVPDIRNRY